MLATDVNEAALAEPGRRGASETRVLERARPGDDRRGGRRGWPGPDVLFNCAGFVASGTILDCDEDQWAFASI